MADKLTSIKIKQKNGSYTTQIPVSVSAQNVQWDGSHSLLDILGSVDINVGGKGNVQHQFDDLYQNIDAFTDDINSEMTDFTNSTNQSIADFTNTANQNFTDFTNATNQHLSDVLGNISTETKGTVQAQMDKLQNDMNTFHTQMAAEIGTDVSDWLQQNVTPAGSMTTIDSSLTISDAAADAKAVGDALTSLNGSLDNTDDNVNDLKNAINSTRVSTSDEFNLICKELYAPNIDFTDVTWVRVYNGFNNAYGFRFYTASNQVVAFVNFSSSDWLSNHVVVNGRQQSALLGDISLIGGTYKDYRNLTINDVTQVIYDSPAISTTYAVREKYRYLKAKFFSASANVINETEITGTTTTGKIINADGIEKTDSEYSIIEFNVSEGKIYKITNLGAGNSYKDIITAEVIANDITVSRYYASDPNRHTLYISDVTGTAKVCYRNNVTPVITECDRYDFDRSITRIGYELSPENIPTGGQVLYNADTMAESGHIVNAIAYKDGVIIAARSNGKVVRIGYDGTETELLSITGYSFDWRLCWMDSNETVFVSPHATRGTMTMTERGLYRLAKGESSFTKVISLYDPTSSIVTETEENNDTIWTMCEDNAGNLYAGVYAHTTHDNPAIYKSTDGGVTWSYLINFKTAGLTPVGKHIHSVIYSPWQKALYCIVGEINKIWKSVNGGATWTDIGVTLPYDKGSAMLALPYGILIGSDGAYNCALNLLYPDDKTYKTVYVGWANTVFAIRRSDETGFIYAFCKIDSSALYQKYYPPYSVLSLSGAEQEAAIQAWRTSDANPLYSKWLAYHESVKDIFPDDAIIPTHYAILVSRDGGKSFEILKKFNSPASDPDGFWTTGFAMNGEILTGHYVSTQGWVYPIVISEGKHKYVSGGCDFSGEIFIRTNSSATASIL